MKILLYAVSVVWALVCLKLFVDSLLDKSRYPFLQRFEFALTLAVLTVAGNVYVFYDDLAAARDAANVAGGAQFIFLMVAMIALCFPAAGVLGAASGNQFGNLMSGLVSGAFGLRNRPSYDKAMAAEKRLDLEGAEQCYLDFFKESRRRGFREDDLAEGRLAYGNLLLRLQRPDEAADQFELAARGNLSPDQCQVAAMRAAERFCQTGQTPRARKLLQAAIERYPREATTKALAARLRNLTGEAP